MFYVLGLFILLPERVVLVYPTWIVLGKGLGSQIVGLTNTVDTFFRCNQLKRNKKEKKMVPNLGHMGINGGEGRGPFHKL